MKYLKKWLWALLALALILPFLSGNVSAEEKIPNETGETKAVTYKDSGRTSVGKLTMEELCARLDAIPAVASLYATEPIVSGTNYRPAVLSKAGYDNAKGWINYYRAAAGLAEVTFTDELNLSASWGGLVLAMNDKLTHYPDQPEGMLDEDYQKGYDATTSSNISYSGGYAESEVLRIAVKGQMEDKSAGNIPMLGHRRWLLNPGTKTMGVGTANTEADSRPNYYTDVRVFGTGVSTGSVTDYEFIAWPASGNNLSDTFPATTPWSITLNPSLYTTPQKANVTVKVTRKSDGTVWTFDQNDYTSNSNLIGADYEYFNVETNYYGVNNCIIFRPAYGAFDKYEGEYTVDVTGLQDASGNETELHYKALFAAYGAPHVHEYELKSWSWADDFSAATATFVCKGDASHTLKLDATVTKKTTAATCETAGKTVYTAKVTLDGTTYTDKKTFTIPAPGHNWGAAVFTWQGYTSAEATRTCQRDTSHQETVTCTIRSEVTKEPTETEDGLRTYFAKATFRDGTVAEDTKTEVLPAGKWIWTRLAGSNRYQTMALAARKAFDDKSCTTLIVASGQAFPDALSGSALAGALGCPILLTNKSKLSSDTKSEIQRLAAPGCNVLILGGNGAVSADVEAEIRALGVTTERVSGSNREATAAAVFEKGNFPEGGTIIVATGYAYADVLSISSYAYAAGTPIILAKKDGSLSAGTKALIEGTIKPSKVIVIGGSKAVSAESEDYLKDIAGKDNVMRLSGSNRYITSAEIMKWELGLATDAPFQPEVEMHADGMGVATGTNFADALGATSLLGKIASPLLLVADNNKTNREQTQANINELVAPFTKDMTKGYIFGGKGAVSLQIEEWLNEAVE